MLVVQDYISLFESVPDLLLVLSPDLQITLASDAYLKATVTTRERIVGQYLFELFTHHPDSVENEEETNLKASFKYVLDHKVPHAVWKQKYDIRRPDGVSETRYWNLLNTPVLNAQGDVICIIHAARDSTEIIKKQKADEDLSILAGIANSIHDIVITSDTDFRITRWNEAAEKLLEWKSEEVLGKMASSFLNVIYPYQTREQILDSFTKTGYWKGEVIYHTKSGIPVYVLSTASYMKDAEGNLTGTLVLARDITNQKNSEKRLREFEYFFNNSHDLCGIANTLGYFENINTNFSKELGYSTQEFCEIPFIELVHPDDVALTLHEYDKLKSGASVINFINRYRKKDSTYVDLDWNATTNPATEKLYCVARNITERNASARALKESEEQIQTIFRSAPDAVIVIDAEGKIIRWNPRAEVIFGWQANEVIGKQLHETIIPEQHREGHKMGMNHFLRTGEGPILNKQIELPALRKDNSLFDAGISISPTLLNGCYVFIGFISDITERKKSEAALTRLNAELEQRVQQRTSEVAKREKRFRTLIENNNDIISLMDEQFNVVYRSPSAAKITGWQDEEILNKPGTGNIHPDDKEKAADVVKELMANPGKTINTIFRNQHKNGHYLWIEGTITNLLHDEDVGAILFNFRDNTQQKELQDLLHKANVLARIGGWEIDLIKGTVYWSDITREIHETEYTYLPDLSTGINFYLEGHGRDLIKQKVDEAINWGKPWDVELQIVTAKNNIRWIRTMGETEFVNGKCVRVYGSFQDIDDRKKAQLQVQELNEQLEQKVIHRTDQLKKSIEDLEAFSYSVSHDLRAPLRIILGYTTILKEDYGSHLDEEGQRITNVISLNTAKMGQLIDDLLHFFQLARKDILKRQVNTNELVHEIIENMNLPGSGGKIRWTIQPLPDSWADLNALRQVWVNFISNAIKYSSKREEPHIEIGSFDRNNHIAFSIKDNGAGFDAQYMNKLFKVFQRLHRPEEFEGTGVGLAIVEKIIDKHGGTVWAEAELNKGANFYFTLPKE